MLYGAHSSQEPNPNVSLGRWYPKGGGEIEGEPIDREQTGKVYRDVLIIS